MISIVKDEFLDISCSKSCARIYRLGAHVTDWRGADFSPVLFLSRKSNLDGSKPIRGGVPIVFPWFNQGRTPGLSPAHGFARRAKWELRNVDCTDTLSVAEWFLDNEISQETPGAEHIQQSFAATYKVSLSERILQMELEVRNLSDDTFDFEAAFHTYLRVGDISNTKLSGIGRTEACDPMISSDKFISNNEENELEGINRVYFGAPQVVLEDTSCNQKIQISSPGCTNLIVWNPSAEEVKNMPDLAEDERHQFICVEAGRIYDDAVILAPGQTTQLAYKLEVIR